MKTKQRIWSILNLLFALSLITGTALAQPCLESEVLLSYEVCPDDIIVVNGTIYDQNNPSGVEVIVDGSYMGCDSIIYVDLTFVPSIQEVITYTGCIGDGYEVEVLGNIYNENNPTGTEILSSSSSSGCDSIIIIDLVFENSIALEITSTSLASCPDNNSTSACDKTCANSTISYTVPNSQNLELEWEVLGAESYEVDNNLITVNWGNPGVGEINVQSASPSNTGPSPLNLHVDCHVLIPEVFGITGGAVAAYGHGGTEPYYYEWSNGTVNQNVIYNIPGSIIYTVTVTDATGITASCLTYLDSPQGCQGGPIGFENNINVIQNSNAGPDCFSPTNNNGSIDITTTGGVPPYTFLWSNAATTEDINNLTSGDYILTITDVNNCTRIKQFSIGCVEENPCATEPMTLYCYTVLPTTSQLETGVAFVQFFGGSPPYDILWDNSEDTPSACCLSSGYHSVTVTDANGCAASCETYVNEWASSACIDPSYIHIVDYPTDCTTSDGIIQVEFQNDPISAGTYLWNTGSTSNTIYNLSVDTYTVTITNNNSGCTSEQSITLSCNQQNAPATCQGEGSLCIDIIAEPQAQFISDPPDVDGIIELCQGESVTFQNLSDYAENYIWELGDGYSTSAQDVTHAYTESGVYDVLLIARNECFCIDTTSIKILVSDAIIPEIECVGTVCTDQSQTYTTTADCGTFNWSVAANGTINDGGSTSDNFITVDWGSGPAGTVSLQVSSCTGNYCSNPSSISIPIIVDNVLIDGPINVCPGEVSTYSIPQWSATEYVWSASTFGEIKSGQGTNTITVKWNVASAILEQQWVHVEYNNCYLECGGESTKDIYITPAFYVAGPIEICENSSSTYAAFDEVNAIPVSCNWSLYDADENIIWTAGSASPVATVDWPAGNGKYILVASAENAANYCSPDYSIIVSVISGPPIVGGINGLNSICPGEFYTYEVQANQANVAYNWTINNGGILSENTGPIINVQWGTNPPYELNVTQTSTAGLACSSQDFSMIIDAINSISLSGPEQVCIESTHQYVASNIGNATYDWTILPASAGTILNGQGSDTINIIWNEVGSANLNINVCGTGENIPINIFGYPVPIVSHPDSLCPNTTGLLSVAGTFSSYSWRDESGNETSNSANPNLAPGFYDLRVTNDAGCEGQTTFSIHSLPQPVINISKSGLDFYCEAAGLPIPTLFALNTDEGYTYEWFRNGISLNIFTDSYTPTQAGTYLVEVMDINNCNAQSNSITLFENCGGGGGDIPLPGVGCSNVSNNINTGTTCVHGLFENTSSNYLAGTVQWNFGDPASGIDNTSTLENPVHFFPAAGYYPISMQVTMLDGNECVLLKDFEVPVQADFDAISNCPGEAVEFEDLSTFTPTSSIATWNWNFGDPASGSSNTSNNQHPNHIFNTLGNYEVTLIITAPSGCTSTTIKTISVLPPPTASFDLPNISCAETGVGFSLNSSPGITSFEWNFDEPASGAANTSRLANTFHAFSNAGIYNVQLKVFNIYGCSDSISIPVSISQNNLSGLIDLAPGSPLCEGTSATITSPPGASSWIWSNDITSESFTQIETGVFELTITDDNGCDYSPPAVTLDIIAEPEATIKVTEYNEYGQPVDCFFNGYILCEGEDVFLSITGAGDYSYVWSSGEAGDEVAYDEEHGGTLPAGDYEYEVTVTDNITGCTSVEGPFSITVNPVPTDIVIASAPAGPICELTTAAFTVTNPDPQLTYLWSTGEYGNTITASTVGEYFVRGISGFGCEGESNILEIYGAPDISLVPDGCLSRCNPDTICLPNIPGVSEYQWYFNDAPIASPEGNDPNFLPTESGTYKVELTDNLGCFAISDPFNIDLLPLDTSSLQLGACEGNMVEFDGELLPPGSVTEFSYTNQYGCDSMITVTVLSAINYEENISLSACEGSSIIFAGEAYFPGTDTSINLLTQLMCDSIINLVVNPLPTSQETLNLSTCTGTTLLYAGEILEPGTSTDFTFTNQFLCDSMVTVIVSENLNYQDTVSLSGCEGTMLSYEGVDFPVGTNQIFNFNTINNCDSSVFLSIAALPTYNEVQNLAACTGTNIVLPGGLTLAAGTDTTLQLSSQYGCDSIVQIMVEAVDEFEINIDLDACEGGTATYEGTDYPAGSNLEFNFISQQGCDSTIYLSVSSLPIQNNLLELSACAGTTIEYLGEDLEPGTTTDFILTNQFNCDSIVSVTVLENLSYYETVNVDGCEGGTIIYDGIEYPSGSSQELNYTSVDNCDSIILLNISALQTDATTVQLSACPGETVEYLGDDLPAASSNTYTFVNQYNCDSVVQVNVSELISQNETVNLVGCDGASVIFDGVEYAAGTQIVLTYSNQSGCDSIINLNIAALPSYYTPITLEACEGSSINYLGLDLEIGTTTEFPYSTSTGCDSIITVEVIPYPTFNFDINPAEQICWNSNEGEIEISNLSGGTEPFTFSLDGINYQTDQLITNLAGGDYSIYVQDGNGCVKEEAIAIPVIAPLEMGFNAPTIACDEDSVIVQSFLLNGLTDSMIYQWQHDFVGPVIPIYNPGTYVVDVSNLCETQNFEVEVLLEDGFRQNYIYIPNAFSPNGDGVNDIFKAYAADGLTVISYELHLYDRWGNTLYTTTDIDEGWDGVFLNEAMNPGVYVWWLRAKVISCRNEIDLFEKGDVTIMK